MEEKKVLYKAFARFSISLGVMGGMTFAKAKKYISERFNSHPNSPFILDFIENLRQAEDDHIEALFDECVRVCDELGPSRDYVTLVMMLESLGLFVSEKDETAKNKYLKALIERFKKEIVLINQKIPKPPLFNMIMEGRSLIEWSSIYCIYPFIPKRIKGEGKPVLLIPPYLGDDFSTSFVRRYLKSLGFTTYKWEMGFNMVKSHYIPRLEEKLDDIYEIHKEKVSIVGWSGGGIFAKIMANRHPNQIEQIITIGSPIWGVMDMKTPVYGLLEFFRGKSLKERNERFLAELEPIPEVPVTCIYTKTDGLVPWKHCMEAETFRSNIKNIEVFGSHSGMGANASVLLITANALSANIRGKEIKDVTTNIERFLYPYFWSNRNLLFRKKKSIT
ncbi:esterase/lipase family protein [Ulvibacter antarcticus]|uniref:Esterase/lipase n=1 Tax=Ulvibacter antarcticus TaxID=442714 RepID=A0A3L9YL12_9FLAO|nr:alpha/beta hydrolase [Ulvibacter antarcticus]RMA58698.1 esterase/lipase [Ulvibacter antarcticus]